MLDYGTSIFRIANETNANTPSDATRFRTRLAAKQEFLLVERSRSQSVSSGNFQKFFLLNAGGNARKIMWPFWQTPADAIVRRQPVAFVRVH